MIDQPENPAPQPDNKPITGINIVGINLLIVIGYSVIGRLFEGGWLFSAFAIFVNVIVCLCLAVYKKNWVWLLSAFVVVCLGFATCVGGLK